MLSSWPCLAMTCLCSSTAALNEACNSTHTFSTALWRVSKLPAGGLCLIVSAYISWLDCLQNLSSNAKVALLLALSN